MDKQVNVNKQASLDKQSQLVAEFKIYYTRFLDPTGAVIRPLPSFAADPENLIALYKMMVKTRLFDAKAIALQRTGKLGTYPSTLGQEAIGVGVGAAMKTEDVFCPYYRDYGTQFWRGVTMEEIFQYWGGNEAGSHFKKAVQDFPICVPIASQTLHAVGIATAMKLRHEPRVSVVSVGDGGTSRGDFYESLNLAGVWQLPVVFVINNNGWAISMPTHAQTATQTLAQKGIAGNVPSCQVDGNDVIAVRHCVGEAVEKARKGGGPSLIEALSYRMSDHTTADDAKRYRKEAELTARLAEDPIHRLYHYLHQARFWNETQDKAFKEQVAAEVKQAVENYQNTQDKSPETMFDYLYAELPLAYHNEREEVAALEHLDHG